MADTARGSNAPAPRPPYVEVRRHDFPEDIDPFTALQLPTSILTAYARVEMRPPDSKPLALIKTTTHPTLPLNIHNYTDASTRRHVANPLVRSARVLVTESGTGKVVSRSFSKFFNFHEKWSYKPVGDEFAVVVEEKVDGSIISIFWYAGEWRIISKSQFEGQHVDAAREVLDELYPGATDSFDKEKTYVFELVDPRMPQPVIYPEKKLVLLTIIGKDGSEPEWGFDWSKYPFPRPRVQRIDDTTKVNMKELKRMNLVNEEGFVVKFYRTKGDRRPQRVKVKFDLYLTRVKSSINVSPRGMVDAYIRARCTIPSLDWEGRVKPKLQEIRESNMQSFLKIADDFGGEQWMADVEALDARVHAFFEEKELALLQAMATLREAGYGNPGTTEKEERSEFARRVTGDFDGSLRNALFSWYKGDSDGRVVDMFVKSVKIPDSLNDEASLGTKIRPKGKKQS